MEKFAIDTDTIGLEVCLDCIIEKSEIARKYKPHEYYDTHGNEPDWEQMFISEIRKAKKVLFRGRCFYVYYFKRRIVSIFFASNVYVFDSYCCDCPIFERIYNNWEHHKEKPILKE